MRHVEAKQGRMYGTFVHCLAFTEAANRPLYLKPGPHLYANANEAYPNKCPIWAKTGLFGILLDSK